MRELVLTSVRKKEDFWRMEYTTSSMKRANLVEKMFEIRKEMNPVNSGVVEDFGMHCMAWADFTTRPDAVDFLEKLSQEMSMVSEAFNDL